MDCVLYFALLGALFDLEEGDTLYLVIAIFMVKLLFAMVFASFILQWLR